MLDRMDAMLFAAPVFLFGLWITGASSRVLSGEVPLTPGG
jgi:hypothetical protein